MHPKIRMSEAELNDFLAAHKTARVGTVSPDGYPHNVPVGYWWRDRTLWLV